MYKETDLSSPEETFRDTLADKPEMRMLCRLTTPMYPHMLLEFLAKNRSRTTVVFTITTWSALETMKLAVMVQAAQLGRRAQQTFAFGTVVIDGLGFETAQHTLTWHSGANKPIAITNYNMF